jgi:hypothetical protein
MEQSEEELSKLEDSQHGVDVKGSKLFLMPSFVVGNDALCLRNYLIFEQK